METTLVCLSHLRWDHVWQRPHHLMARLAQRVPVIFVEEPEIGMWPGVHAPHWQAQEGLPGVCVLRPRFPTSVLDTPGNSYPEIWTYLFKQLVADLPTRPIIWEYSPLMVYLTAAAQPRLVVYDCMDELANFRGTPSAIREREARLMSLADLVFTGGWSMYEARKHGHPQVHCFPSGVEVEHYAQTVATPPPDVAALPQPRLGYFGVLDERLDWQLINDVALSRPAWQWVFVGPTAKLDPADLPQHLNIHYLGQRPYAELPAYLQSFDVATMPFARNDATRYISPTKTLEYMAGHVPIIATPIPDVVRSYRERVHLATTSDEWVGAVEGALGETPAARARRVVAEDALLADQGWDSIAAQMWTLIEARLAMAQKMRWGAALPNVSV